MRCEKTYLRRCNGVEQTISFAETLAKHLKPGDVVLLNGEMGAGKTQFVKGIARGLGITENIVSPTFNIVLSYEHATLPLNHFDLYRLEDECELEDIAYWELLEGDRASFVEWGDRFPESLPYDYLELDFVVSQADVREIRCQAHGGRAESLLEAWASCSESKLEVLDCSK